MPAVEVLWRRVTGDTSNIYGIVANHSGDAVVSPGALCWLCGPCDRLDQVSVSVRSRGGRWVRRDLATGKLSAYRAKWLLPVDRRWRDESSWLDRGEAEAVARRLDAAAQAERARRNMREVERMAGLLDERGRRNEGVSGG